jgi:RES domain
MAKRAADYQPPAGPLNATLITWDRGREMHRVHDSAYLGDQFNPTPSGNARFSPIRDRSGAIIPTLYAGTTLDCALMETIFHDLPYKTGFKPVSKRKLTAKVHSIILPQLDLRLVDLGTIALHKLGIDRAHLVDTTKAHYPRTRSWAEALYAQVPDAHGLSWTSRRHDHEQAVMLFGGRLNPSDLEISGPSIPLLEDSNAAVPVIDLATRLGATLVD